MCCHSASCCYVRCRCGCLRCRDCEKCEYEGFGGDIASVLTENAGMQASHVYFSCTRKIWKVYNNRVSVKSNKSIKSDDAVQIARATQVSKYNALFTRLPDVKNGSIKCL